VSRNRVIAVWTPFTVVSRSSLMSLIITFMFEPAKLQMNWASASGRRNLAREKPGRSASGSSVTSLAELQLAGDGVEATPAVAGDGDDVLDTHAEAPCQVDAGLDREAHARLERLRLPLDHVGGL